MLELISLGTCFSSSFVAAVPGLISLQGSLAVSYPDVRVGTNVLLASYGCLLERAVEC